MKYLLLLIPLLLAGCWCKNPQTQTIESIVSCSAYTRSPVIFCIVNTSDWSMYKIAQIRMLKSWWTFTSCN